jgi:hypothetical protein
MNEQLPKDTKLAPLAFETIRACIQPEYRCIEINEGREIVVLTYAEAGALRDWLTRVLA